MALYRLDDESYLDYLFDPELWQGVDTSNPGDLVNNLYPPITSITSLSENNSLVWFFGRVKVKGQGTVKVVYPYSEEHSDSFVLKNVDLSTIPYILLEASPERFIGWFDSRTGEPFTEQLSLVISPDDYTDVTGFEARFGS